MKNILVTGGAGFIGGNFVHYMLENHPEYKIINLDLLTYAGNIHSLDDIKDNPNHIFVQGNITNRELVRHLVKEHSIDAFVNFAAESHVDRSILHPEVFIETNVQGTLALLDVAREMKIEKYLQVSTDEVYGSLGAEGYFTEETPLAPNSPYSASKAAADMLVRAYNGPYHFPEKLIPLMISNGMDNKELPIYGDGLNIRDWLHVQDHCQAIDLVLHKGVNGEVYNVGGHNERTNNEIVDIVIEKLGLSRDLIKYVDDRLGHDKRYAIDPTKLETELGWKPKYTFDTGIVETIEWYQANESWWRPLKDSAKLN